MSTHTHITGIDVAASTAYARRALASDDVDEVIDDGLRTIAASLNVEMVGFLEARADHSTFVFRSGVGWRSGVVGSTIPAGKDAALSFVLTAGAPVTYHDLLEEIRFDPPRILLEHGVRGGIGMVIIGARMEGVLGVHARQPRTFSDDELAFVDSIGTTIAAALQRDRVARHSRRIDERFRRLMARATDIFLQVSLVGPPTIVASNETVEHILGWTQAELAERTVEVIHPHDRTAVLAPAPGITTATVRLRDRRGRDVPFRAHIAPRRDERGRIIAVDLIAHTIEAGDAPPEREHAHIEADRFRALEEMKSAFLEAVSHEFRTPLTGILGLAVTLEDHIDALSPGERDTLISRLAINARRLEQLLSDLLDLDRLGRRTQTLERRPVEALRLVDAAARTVDRAGHDVIVEGEALVCHLDAPRVERIVENLVANSVKHTPPGGTITIAVASAGDGVLLTVEDQGPGIPAEMRESIFEPFIRGPGNEHDPGLGIGLSLVARHAELHNGRAWVEDSPNGGARFHVLLPGS